jgi:hypothetical protein
MAPDAVMRVNREVNGLLGREHVRARYADLGAEAVPLTASEYGRLVANDRTHVRPHATIEALPA